MTRSRILIVSAFLAGLAPLVGNGLYAGPTGSGDAILAEARQGLPSIAIFAYTLELLGLGALGVLLAWLVTFLSGRAPVAAAATAIAGTAMLAVKLGSVVPIMTLHSMTDTLDAVAAETLVVMNGLAFVVSGLLLSAAFLAAGIGLLGSDVPRWLSWWATVAGALGVVAGMVGVVRPEAYVPIPFLLLLAWMIAVAVTAVMRPTGVGPGSDADRAPRQLAASE